MIGMSLFFILLLVTIMCRPFSTLICLRFEYGNWIIKTKYLSQNTGQDVYDLSFFIIGCC